MLEAMACGTPVVLARAPALCEVGGDAAAFFEPGSSEDLSAVLSDVIGDATSVRDLSQRGRARASLFSWAQSAAATAQIYHQLV